MPAFDFPNPPTPDQEVTNDATGVTYRYDAATQSWVIVSSQSATNIANDVAQLQSDVNTLESLLPLETTARQQGDANLQSQIDDIDVDDIDLSDYYTKTEVDDIIDDIDLSDYYTKTEVDDIIDDIGPAVDPGNYYTKAETDATTNGLQIQINDLAVTKGAASVYTLNDIGVVVGIRPGDFYIDNTVAKNVSFITLAPTDNNGNDRPLGTTGDIFELVGINNKHYRYRITTAADGVAGVEFITAEDPDDLLIPGTTFQVFIYPQNSASASVEYVDAGLATKLSLTGGEMTGDLKMIGGAINTNALVKSTRTSGYAFQVHDEDNDTNVAFIHSNGNIRGAQGVFTDTLEVRQAATFKKNINCDQNINVTGSVNNGGGWISGNWGFDQNEKGLRWYTSDRGDNHLADITWQTAKLETLMYNDYLWTLKVQNQDNTDSNVLIYADYSSGLILNEVGELNTNGNVSIGGNLAFSNGGTINVSSGGTVLSGRASLDIKTAADYPVVISSGSSYKKVLAIYGFDGDADDNRGETAYINADGKAYFSEVYANDEELATQTYVDGMGQIYYGNIVPAGSDVNDGDLWVDSGNMRLLMRASGAWVNPDREADTDSFKANANPNGRKFGFSSGTGVVTGKLNYYDSGGLKLRLSNTDAFGIKWNDGGITQDVTMSSGPYFTITEVVDGTNHKIIRQGRVSRIDYHSSDILCHLSSHRTNGGFSTSKQYWVNIGGII